MFIVPVTRDARQLSRLLDDTFDRFFGAAADTAPAARTPALDVVESERHYTVKLEVPGVAKEDVKVSVEGRKVTVSASAQATEDVKDGDRIVYRERSTSSYSRSFTLPVELDQTEAGAKLEHGVLTLTLPKRHVRAAAQITIN